MTHYSPRQMPDDDLIAAIRRLSDEMSPERLRELADQRRALALELVSRSGGLQSEAARRLGWAPGRFGAICRGQRGAGRRRRRAGAGVAEEM